jgi:hypothetical protein
MVVAAVGGRERLGFKRSQEGDLREGRREQVAWSARPPKASTLPACLVEEEDIKGTNGDGWAWLVGRFLLPFSLFIKTICCYYFLCFVLKRITNSF